MEDSQIRRRKSGLAYQLRKIIQLLKDRASRANRIHTHEVQESNVEDYRNGYPRYAGLISVDGSLHICRRFGVLRARVLLAKQDGISVLEKQLEHIDNEEHSPLFLGSLRDDRNVQRARVMTEIDMALAEYDALVERNSRILGYESAPTRGIANLQHWLNANWCLSRDETAYLLKGNDLMCLNPIRDSGIDRLVSLGEDLLIWLCKILEMDWQLPISRDPKIHQFSGPLTALVAQTFLLIIVLLLLLIPVIICNVFSTTVPRVITIAISTSTFLAILSGLGKASSTEIFLAGATYSTVLVVFIPGASAVSQN
ncbi:hypothetical protein EV356DRAFT_496982 [Viridothelium virens]|uniref:DUF6594 domain-containing protein n=1 Tax=Viridothelium virens TaxID=1048519 RepID=A0A6A6GTG9_VIRVR|nr:hypothetical protein EV356DRAFT_496982 [Viridothelium virens]